MSPTPGLPLVRVLLLATALAVTSCGEKKVIVCAGTGPAVRILPPAETLSVGQESELRADVAFNDCGQSNGRPVKFTWMASGQLSVTATGDSTATVKALGLGKWNVIARLTSELAVGAAQIVVVAP